MLKAENLYQYYSSLCNLSCRYCYADEGSYGNESTRKNMSLETLQNTIKNILDIFPNGIKYIQFFGGEPLINKSFMLNCIPIINGIYESKKLTLPLYTIVTNGTLINDEYIELFNNYFESVTISLDGERNINDHNRIYSDSEESVFDNVTESIKAMKERSFYLGTEGTITRLHIQNFKENNQIKSYETLSTLDLDYIHIAPMIDSKNEFLSLCNEKVIGL